MIPCPLAASRAKVRWDEPRLTASRERARERGREGETESRQLVNPQRENSGTCNCRGQQPVKSLPAGRLLAR